MDSRDEHGAAGGREGKSEMQLGRGSVNMEFVGMAGVGKLTIEFS